MQVNAFTPHQSDDPSKRLITKGDEFERLMRFLESRPKFVVDYETSGLAWHQHSEAVGVAFGAWDDQDRLWNAYVPFRHQTGEPQLEWEVIRPGVQRLLEDESKLKIAHGIKFEDHISRKEGIQIRGPRYCTLVGARFYNENELVALEHRAKVDLGYTDAKEWQRTLNLEVHRLAKANKMKVTRYKHLCGYAQVSTGLTGIYACTDTTYAGGLFQKYERWGLSSHYPRIWPTEMELTRILCDMEENGLLVDVEYLTQVRDQVTEAKARIEEHFKAQLGASMFNLGSDDEVRRFLTDYLRLPLWKKTRGNKFSVDSEVISYFAQSQPLLKHLLVWREADKIETTYTDSFIEKLDAYNVCHGSFRQEGTNTGRLSSAGPNMQNIVSESDARAIAHTGKPIEDGGIDPWSIKRAFQIPTGQARFFFDYSQIELRVLAYFSRDPIMVDVYLSGGDIHKRTQEEVSAMIGREVKRRPAKVINFGLAYGLTAQGLSTQASISLDDAELFLDKFFQRYAGISTFREHFWNELWREPSHSFNNPFGRTRRLPDIVAGERWQRERAQRQAIATLIQGTAAELTKESMVRLDHFIREEKLPARLVSTVHDEIQIDADPQCQAQLVSGVKERMENYPEFQPIPIVVDVEWSKTTWADKQPYNPGTGT